MLIDDAAQRPDDSDWIADADLRRQVKECQEVSDYLLGHFDQVCSTVGVEYFLSGGVLLGALRNHGWIPWDDDVDVMMLREDFERLDSQLPSLLPDSLKYSRPGDPRHVTPVPRIIYTPSRLVVEERFGMRPPERQHVVLDIFIWDRAPRQRLIRQSWMSAVRLLQVSVAIRSTTLQRIRMSKESRRARFAASTLLALSRAVPQRALSRLPDRAAALWRKSSSPLRVSLNHSMKSRGVVLDIEDFRSRVDRVNFQGKEYLAPCIASYLVPLYGPDFINPPPIESRKPHTFERFSVDLGSIKT